jgi:hypothetical protein
MTTTLHSVSIGAFQQSLGAVSAFMEKGRAHCVENNIDLNEVVGTRLCEDMLPLRFQVISVVHHSLGALQGVEAGEFRPPPSLELDYEGLQGLVADAVTGIQEYDEATVNGFDGKDVIFRVGDREVPFLAEEFLTSFSLPNFYFHITTAYDILRFLGVPLGKRDYMGRMRIKR